MRRRENERQTVKIDTKFYLEDFMYGFDMSEMIIVLVMILVVFGADKLPEIGGAFGMSARNFKKYSEGKNEIGIKPRVEHDVKKKA
jgi:sec-independent protein translocase protein TatA